MPGVDPVEALPGRLAILPRDAWGPDLPPRAEHASEDVRFLLVHHTASANTYPSGGARSVIRSTYAFQTGPAKGWPDVCYHFFVDHDGVIWEGRAGSLAGPVVADATGGNQGFAQLVCLIGDFTSTVPTAAALDSLTGVLAWLADRYSVPTEPGVLVPFVSRGSQRWPAGTTVMTEGVRPHRSMSYTACPGDAFAPFVESELMARVAQRRRDWADVLDPDPPLRATRGELHARNG
ncbi:MAG: N-acetylmuramoyl-L-alanine amidase [Ilumatobacteraceae bacterium]